MLRSFELMVNGAEVLLTDPGRDVRLVFTDSLKSLSGVNAKFPTSISKESLVVKTYISWTYISLNYCTFPFI